MDCKLFINGNWVEGASDRRIGVMNPATEEVIAEYNYASRAQVAEAFSAAQAGLRPLAQGHRLRARRGAEGYCHPYARARG